MVSTWSRQAEQTGKCATRLANYRTELAAKQQQVADEEANYERISK